MLIFDIVGLVTHQAGRADGNLLSARSGCYRTDVIKKTCSA